MGKINIYGTLHNDTNEPIADAGQISITVGNEKKWLPEYLNELGETGSEELTDEDIAEILEAAKQQSSDDNDTEEQ